MADPKAAPGKRWTVGRYRFEYARWQPRWRRWGCESRGRGVGCHATPLHAWLHQRRWEREPVQPI